ncbi:phosphatase PAP2 family protein [Terriglobus sp. TAA 43]|uniref:acid phosphatase n=1 Tax=Terriglobus sp. TAA 43 TaxID=278961 RepID=UPI000645FFBA|nr:phosphatase PAP2 family protein [Terriglobus sp. TAA 43]
MRQFNTSLALSGLFLFASVLTSQSPAPSISPLHTKSPLAASPKSSFLADSPLDVSLLVQQPPANNSETTQQELKQLHTIEQSRSSQDVAAAQADDSEEDIFVYKNIFGSDFTAENLPVLASLSADVHREEGIASAPLKAQFSRPRPYQIDRTLRPVCKLTQAANSYPSGHTISGYLLGYTMAYIVPAKRDEILARTDEYAFHRLVCGVHYSSDLVAGHTIASAMFGVMMTNPMFRNRVEAARQELRAKLPTALSQR